MRRKVSQPTAMPALVMPIKLLVALSNPGEAYQRTRHNAGAWFLDELAHSEQLVFAPEKKFQAELATLRVAGLSCLLVRPTVFMNHNGSSVRAVSQFYRLLPADILVVHDDLDLVPGRVKLKTGGGHGGHNGLRDVIAQLGSHDFHRLRIGIGHPGHKTLVHDYVLGTPSAADKKAILTSIARVLPHLPALLAGQFDQVTNRLARDKDNYGI